MQFRYYKASLAFPDLLSAGAYRLETVSAALQVSGTVHRPKNHHSTVSVLGVNKVTYIIKRLINYLHYDKQAYHTTGLRTTCEF